MTRKQTSITENFKTLIPSWSPRRSASLIVAELQAVKKPLRQLGRCLALLDTVAKCDNGPRTRLMMRSALNPFAAQLQALDRVCQNADRTACATVPWPAIDTAATACRQVCAQAAHYLVEETDSAQVDLRPLIVQTASRLCVVYAQLKTARGHSQPSGSRPTLPTFILEQVRLRWHTNKLSWVDTIRQYHHSLQQKDRCGGMTELEKRALAQLNAVTDPVSYVDNLDKKAKAVGPK